MSFIEICKNNLVYVCHKKELGRYVHGKGHILISKVKTDPKWACPGHKYVIYCEI